MDDNYWHQILQNFQAGLAVIAGSATILGASGYVILHSHLSQYTDIPVTNIPIIYYWIAGLTLAVSTALVIIVFWAGASFGNLLVQLETSITETNSKKIPKWLKPMIGKLWIPFGIAYLIGIVWVIYLYPDFLWLAGFIFVPFLLLVLVFAATIDPDKQLNFIQRCTTYFQQPTLVFHHFYQSFMASIAFFLYIAFYTVLISILYGSVTYATLPVSVGGGAPATVTFLFSSAEALEQSHMTPLSDTQSEEVCLLMPLENAYLVFDPTSQQTLLIRSDDIIAIVDSENTTQDCSPPSSQVTSPPLIVPTSTP
ncbi:MAG: hypothetical protein AAF126_25750 [Chloroflexota bacterium]